MPLAPLGGGRVGDFAEKVQQRAGAGVAALLGDGANTLRFEGSGAGASCLDMVSLQLLRRIPSGSMLIVR